MATKMQTQLCHTPAGCTDAPPKGTPSNFEGCNSVMVCEGTCAPGLSSTTVKDGNNMVYEGFSAIDKNGSRKRINAAKFVH